MAGSGRVPRPAPSRLRRVRGGALGVRCLSVATGTGGADFRGPAAVVGGVWGYSGIPGHSQRFLSSIAQTARQCTCRWSERTESPGSARRCRPGPSAVALSTRSSKGSAASALSRDKETDSNETQAIHIASGPAGAVSTPHTGDHTHTESRILSLTSNRQALATPNDQAACSAGLDRRATPVQPRRENCWFCGTGQCLTMPCGSMTNFFAAPLSKSA